MLLELSVDPPENDQKIIDEAIKKKQAEWGRFRNHPTKAIQAQKNIGMIPEIREVMGNEALRAKEAQAAIEIARERDKKKFEKIDRHLRILMSKGKVKEEEIKRLKTLHQIKEVNKIPPLKLCTINSHSLLVTNISERCRACFVRSSGRNEPISFSLR